MITGKFWSVHDDDTLRRIDAAAVRLLVKAGCRIEHEGLLDLLGAAGCRLDRGAMRCYFSEGLVREAIARYERPDLDEAKVGELRSIFLAAEREVLAENTTPV